MELTINNIGKKYAHNLWGVRDLSLGLKPGVIGLLGPNGAGKSTLMRMLATITKPSEGTILWNDIDAIKNPDTLRSVLGYLPQDFGVYPHLSALEFLQYIAALKGIRANVAKQRINQLLQLVNLTSVSHRPLGSYSGGMRQRVGIAQALLNDPQLLIVDEPTVGLDPEERVRFRNLIAELSGERIIILSTHIVSDIEATATDIAVMREGQLLFHNSPEALLQSIEGGVWHCVIPSSELKDAQSRYLISSTIRRSDGIHIRIIGNHAPPMATEQVIPTIEDAYLAMISENPSLELA